MIAKILGTSSSFPAINYNDEKIDKGKGELMGIYNTHHSELSKIESSVMRKYLSEISEKNKVNKDFKNVQFHATISCKGKEFDRQQLKDIAKNWMDEMGYGKQPYIIIAHNDTKNNHVHIVSTRVDIETGKKINDSNEGYKARNSINKIMERDFGIDQKFKTENKIKDFINSYSFDSFNSMKTFLNSENQKVFLDKDDSNILNVYNNDWKEKFKIDELKLDYELSSGDKKKYQAILFKYKEKLDSTIYGYSNANKDGFYKYNSEFINELRNKMGIELKPVIKNGKVSNYTLIDHTNKRVLNGNGIMNSKVLFKDEIKTLDLTLINRINNLNINSTEKLDALSDIFNVPKFALEINYKNDNEAISSLKFYMKEYNLGIEDLAKETNSQLFSSNGNTFFLNEEKGIFENVNDMIDKKQNIKLEEEPKYSFENEMDFSEAKNIIHSISGALRTGEDGGQANNNKPKGKRKKR